MLLILLLLSTVWATPVPVILSTDIGEDIDDSWALGMIVGRPDLFTPLLVVTEHGNSTLKAVEVAKYLRLWKRTDVSIGIGVPQIDGNRECLQGWAQDSDKDAYIAAGGHWIEDGIAAMAKTIINAKEPPIIVEIGPPLNMKALIDRFPEVVAKVGRVVAMNGCFNQQNTPCHEHNAATAASSTIAMFQAKWNLTMNPSEVCGQVRINGKRMESLWTAAAQDSYVSTMLDSYCYWSDHGGYVHDCHTESSPLFDPASSTMSIHMDPPFVVKQARVAVNNNGETYYDPSGYLVNVATGYCDGGLDQVEDDITNGFLHHQ